MAGLNQGPKGNWKKSLSVCVSHSVVSDSLQPHGLYPTLSMEFSSKNIGVGIAMHFSRGSFQPRDLTQEFHIAGRFFTISVTWVEVIAPGAKMIQKRWGRGRCERHTCLTHDLLSKCRDGAVRRRVLRAPLPTSPGQHFCSLTCLTSPFPGSSSLSLMRM